MSISSYSTKDLQSLIKALSGSEKRYFSLLSTAFIKSEKEPIYLKLFQSLLDADTELSDNKIPAEQLVLRKRLLENILRSLRLFHQNKSVDIILLNTLSDIELLYDLNLPGQSYYLLQKACQQARKHEKFALLLQLLEWEKKINMYLTKPIRSIDEIAQEEQHIVSQVSQLMVLERIFSRMKQLKKEYGQIKGAISLHLQDELNRITADISYDECLSQKARYYYNYTYTLFNWISFNHKNAYQFSLRLLNSDFGDVLPTEYISGILEHATSCIQIGRFEEALSVLANAQQAALKSGTDTMPVLKTKLFFYTLGYQLVIYNYQGDIEKLQATINKAEQELPLYEKSIPKEAMNVLLANLMNAYLGVSNQKKVDELWNVLFQNSSKEARKSIYDDLRLFRLFNHIACRLYDIVAPAALSAHRYYSKRAGMDSDFSPELEIAAILQKTYNWEDPKQRSAIVQTIKQILTRHIGSLDHELKFQEQYSFYSIWADSIESEQPFHLVAKKWHEQF